MTIHEDSCEDEHIPPPPFFNAAVTSRTSNKQQQEQRDLSFDMTETSDHSSTTNGSIVLRNTGTTGKVLLLSTAIVGLLCSIYTNLSCRFLLVQGVPSDQESSFSMAIMGAFSTNTTTTATTKAVGIFSYATQDFTNPLDFAKSCVPYPDQFWESDMGPLFWSAQLSALLAPSVGGLALMIQLVEVMRRQFLRNFLLVVFLYLMASLIQGYTFAIYGALDFCWGDNAVQCTLSDSGWASVAAAASYYLCVILLCLVPRQSIQTLSSNHHNSNKAVGSQDHIPPVTHAHTLSTTSSIGMMEEGQRSVRFEDPPVSHTRILE